MYVIQVPNFNLDQIYITGQSPRWIKVRDGKYIIPFRDKALKIEQKKERFILNCDDEDFYNIWYKYFDLGCDYQTLNYSIYTQDREDKDLLYVAARRGSGIHILRQDLWEVMVLSLLESCCANDEEFLYCLQELEIVAGIKHAQAMREAGKIVWYEFPDPERLMSKLKELTYGKELKPLVQDALEGWIDFDLIPTMTYKEAGNLLKSYGYFTTRAIKTICLCACGCKYSTPYQKKYKIDKYVEDMVGFSYEEFEEWYFEGPSKTNKGLVQLYLLHEKRNPVKGMVIWE